MTPALQTLLLAFTEGGLSRPEKALFLGAEYSAHLKDWEILGHQFHRPQAAEWEREGLELTETLSGQWPVVMTLPGKARDEIFLSLARAIEHTEDGGTIVACLPKSAGGPRFEKELRKVLGHADSISKHKCRVFWGTKTDQVKESLLTQWKSLDGKTSIKDTDFVSEVGVFSADHIDAGSAFLAEHLPKRVYGRVADLGAGWGYLSAEVLKRCPSVRSLDLYESDRRALACAEVNVKGDAKLSFHWHDVEQGIEGPYDSIVMNPPFHKGIATDVSLGRGFLRTAHAALKRGGELYMVANRQLPYEAELDELGMRWRKQAENETFKLIFAVKR